MLSTAAAPSTSLAAALPSSSSRARRRRSRVVVAAAAAEAAAREGGTERFAASGGSITDYLRYRRPELGGGGAGGRGGVAGGELQTAVVRFEKRFPWSLLHPFLHVSLLVWSCSFCLLASVEKGEGNWICRCEINACWCFLLLHLNYTFLTQSFRLIKFTVSSSVVYY